MWWQRKAHCASRVTLHIVTEGSDAALVLESSWDAGRSRKTISFGRVLDRVLLQGRQVNKTLAAPNTFELGLPRVHTLVLGKVLALLEALVAAGTLEGFLAGVDTAVALQLRRVLEALLAVRAFQGLFPGGVTAVLDKL